MLTRTSKVRRAVTVVICAAAAALSVVGTPAMAADPPDPASEQYRPYVHFSPTKNWMNDPNGLVYYQGAYHLFYQYNPFGNTWGNMSWGHATSTDLVHWTEQPLALPQDADADIFSGGIVVDHDNTSGFGTADNPPLVAMYTTAYHTGKQAQSLAYSTDAGQTWTKYDGNPVLDRNSNNFRDPHVFWYDGGSPANSYWVVVTVEALDHQVRLYKSTDLKDWTPLSAFGPANATGGQWECPDLFPLAVDGDPNNIKWVMVVSINPGAVGGGSGTQYFVGDFDGTTFTSDSTVGSDTLPAGTVLAGFDNGTYDGWTVNNEPGNGKNGPFGNSPATGPLDGQNPVTGFSGTGLINGFNDGDWPMGSIESPEFTVDQNYLNFLVGGGNHPWQDGTSTTGVDPDGTVANDFESTGWGDWTATGDLIGAGPTAGATAGQATVSGFHGTRLLNTFLNGDATTGTLTSQPFTITSSAIDFMIAGGNHPWGQTNPTALNLVVDGQVVRTATGNDSETPAWQGWDVTDLQGQQATLQAVDDNTGGWGHLLLDQITLADHPVTTFADFENHTGQLPTGWTADGDFAGSGTSTENLDANSQQGLNVLDTCTVPGKCDTATGTFYSPTFTITQDHINFLMAGGIHPWGSADPAAVNLVVNGDVVRTATGNGTGFMNWTAWDVSDLIGQTAQIQVADLHAGNDFGHIMVDAFTFSGSPALPRNTATAVNLVVDGAVVRTATGGNSETLDWASWNVGEFAGKRARISVVDNNRGSWGHILADQFMTSDTAAPTRLRSYDWIDWGRDYYAGITYDNAPDNKRIMIAWMNNWDYANQIPTGQWRSAMALPRELTLKTVDGRPQLVQHVVDQVGSLETPAAYTAEPGDIPAGVNALPAQADSNVAMIDAVFSPGTATKFGLTVRQSADGTEGTPVLYDTATGRLTVDRIHSGDIGFNPTFASVESVPVSLENGKLHLRLYLDRSSVEVFAQNGVRTITDQIFPRDDSNGISLIAQGGTAHLDSLTVTPLNRAMWASTQTITFDALPGKTVGDPDFDVTASASSGLPVTLTATGACTVTGATVHLTGAGDCTLTATQPGNGTYGPADPVSRTFTVGSTVPGAPTGVRATAGDRQATVTWQPPGTDGGSAVTGYTVTANTGNTCTSVTTTCAITELTPGVAYTFTVTATNSIGTGATSAASEPVTVTGTFTRTTDPSIAGSPTPGSVLTANPGVWSPDPASAAYQWLRNGAAIGGATTATYPLQNADLGKSISVRVTVSAPGVPSATATSAPVTVVTGVPGAPTTVKAAAGNRQATVSWKAPANGGSVITSYTVSTASATDGSPVDQGCTVTTGATTCVVTGLTPGVSYTFTVSATNAVGEGPRSAPSTAIKVTGSFNVTTPPSISGTPTIGSTLTVNPGTWSPDPASFTYQWLRNGKNISGATAATFVTGTADQGNTVSVKVTAVTPGVTSVSYTTSGLQIVTSVPSEPTTVTATAGNRQATVRWKVPTVTGGSPITSYAVSTALATDGSPVDQGCTVSTGATTCIVTGLTPGVSYTFTVTATNAAGTGPASTASAAIAVTGSFLVVTAPTISGDPTVGSTLTADPGTWSPTPTTFTYQWLRNGAAISGAKASTYIPVTADRGKQLTVRITATSPGVTNTNAVSPAVTVT